MTVTRTALAAVGSLKSTQRTLQDLQGPQCIPLLGNFLLYLKKENRGCLHKALAKEHDKYGPMFRGQLGTQNQLHVCDPKLIAQILRNEGKYPNRPTFNSWNMYRRIEGKEAGPFSGSGEQWKRNRHELNAILIPQRNVESYCAPLQDITNDFVTRIRHIRDNEGDHYLANTFSNETYKWSMEGMGTILFEQRMGCLSANVPRRVQTFIDSIDDMLTSSLELMVGEEVHRALNTRYWQRHKAAWDNIFSIGKAYINEKMESLSQELSAANDDDLRRKLGEKESGKVLSFLLSRPTMTMEEIYANTTEMLLGGVDTVANTLSFSLYLLARNPDCQQKLYSEIQSVLKSNGLSQVTPEIIGQLPYLQCILKESLRLYPVITMNVRVIEEELIIDGYKMPKKTMYVMNHYKACRDETLFPRPTEFLPERWLRFGKQQRETYSSLPFGLGARACLGKRIANMELHLAISKISQNFRIDKIPGMEMKTVLRTLLSPGKQLPIKFIDRL